jgi:hypothetical protein
LSAANIQVIAPARALASRQQACVSLGDVKHDSACLEQREIAFLIGRNLAERMMRQMRGFLQRPKRNQANLVGLAHLLERPANARITRQSLPAVGRAFKGGDGDGHREAPLPHHGRDSGNTARSSPSMTHGNFELVRV